MGKIICVPILFTIKLIHEIYFWKFQFTSLLMFFYSSASAYLVISQNLRIKSKANHTPYSQLIIEPVNISSDFFAKIYNHSSIIICPEPNSHSSCHRSQLSFVTQKNPFLRPCHIRHYSIILADKQKYHYYQTF